MVVLSSCKLSLRRIHSKMPTLFLAQLPIESTILSCFPFPPFCFNDLSAICNCGSHFGSLLLIFLRFNTFNYVADSVVVWLPLIRSECPFLSNEQKEYVCIRLFFQLKPSIKTIQLLTHYTYMCILKHFKNQC